MSRALAGVERQAVGDPPHRLPQTVRGARTVQGAGPVGEQSENPGHATRVDRVGRFQPLGQPEQTLARGEHRPASQWYRGGKVWSGGPLGVLHPRAQRAGEAAPGPLARQLAPTERTVLDRIATEPLGELLIEARSM